MRNAIFGAVGVLAFASPALAADIFLRVSSVTTRPIWPRLQDDRCASLSRRPVSALLKFCRRSSVCFRPRSDIRIFSQVSGDKSLRFRVLVGCPVELAVITFSVFAAPSFNLWDPEGILRSDENA